MSLYYNLDQTWRTVKFVYAKVSGTWRECAQIYVKVDGVWYPIWEYTWVPSAWTSCSKTCGGGTQTRTLSCTRNDGFDFDTSYCDKFAGTKPSTSQSCNTQTCTTTYECSGTVETEHFDGVCTSQTLTPRTGVFPSYGSQVIRRDRSPFFSAGSMIKGTFYLTTDGGQTCDVYYGCYVVSNGYKYYAKTSSDTPTEWLLSDDKYKDADNGSGGCQSRYTHEKCYPMYRDSV